MIRRATVIIFVSMVALPSLQSVDESSTTDPYSFVDLSELVSPSPQLSIEVSFYDVFEILLVFVLITFCSALVDSNSDRDPDQVFCSKSTDCPFLMATSNTGS
ncbi:hypothetical protein M6B38_268975 [Iris pallida]|uniref:Uncharacterized protein n=1 Tax=Iris pallida TaxID=29817 RepID=A0AAX6IBZ5_IRIPA|nr:hypothetical protein M6B38_268975 [Iris pallida]